MSTNDSTNNVVSADPTQPDAGAPISDATGAVVQPGVKPTGSGTPAGGAATAAVLPDDVAQRTLLARKALDALPLVLRRLPQEARKAMHSLLERDDMAGLLAELQRWKPAHDQHAKRELDNVLMGTEVRRRLEVLSARLTGTADGGIDWAAISVKLTNSYRWTPAEISNLTPAQVVVYLEKSLKGSDRKPAGDGKGGTPAEASPEQGAGSKQEGAFQGESRRDATKPLGTKGKMIDQKMMKKLQEDEHKCLGWSVREWARFLKCTVSSVQGTTTWDKIMDMRTMRAVEAITHRKKQPQTDRRRFGKRRNRSD